VAPEKFACSPKFGLSTLSQNVETPGPGLSVRGSGFSNPRERFIWQRPALEALVKMRERSSSPRRPSDAARFSNPIAWLSFYLMFLRRIVERDGFCGMNLIRPDHFHLLLTPAAEPLEEALQLSCLRGHRRLLEWNWIPRHQGKSPESIYRSVHAGLTLD
jgi:hypothetical protein